MLINSSAHLNSNITTKFYHIRTTWTDNNKNEQELIQISLIFQPKLDCSNVNNFKINQKKNQTMNWERHSIQRYVKFGVD